ncbi:hypothetical protein [Candidatus Enterovibrio altilux]|nr:hypothetical protein [Candidatus Enterovibrio luxaltus]
MDRKVIYIGNDTSCVETYYQDNETYLHDVSLAVAASDTSPDILSVHKVTSRVHAKSKPSKANEVSSIRVVINKIDKFIELVAELIITQCMSTELR